MNEDQCRGLKLMELQGWMMRCCSLDLQNAEWLLKQFSVAILKEISGVNR